MGLLDWLTDIGGQSASIGSAPPNSGMPGQPPQTMPSVQMTGADAPPLQAPPQAMPPAQAPLGPMTAQPPLQMSPPVMPAQAPRPAQADIPPNAAPTGGQVPQNPPQVVPASPSPGMPTTTTTITNPGPGRGFLGQAFGMNSADEKNTLGGLGAGLKSVGDNWNKPGLAAFAGSAGSAIEGGTAAENKRVDQMLSLIKAKQKAGDDSSATTLAGVKLETAKLQLQNLKDNNGKSGAYNKPPQQLYQDAMRLAQNDPNVKASEKALEQTIKDGDAKKIAQAQQDHSALVAAVQDKHLTGVGLPPQSAAAIAKQPGLTAENPVPQAAFSNKPFDQVVKPQPYDQYFVDENGQTRVLKATKKGEAAKTPDVAKTPVPSSPAGAADEDE